MAGGCRQGGGFRDGGFGDECCGGDGSRGRGGRHGFQGGHRRDPRDGNRGRRPLGHGDLRLVLLALVARKASHGYELIKAIEQASSGLYIPSPGVVYPTLSLLVDQDFLTTESEEGQSRKSYAITAAGQAELANNQTAVAAILARLSQLSQQGEGELMPGIHENLTQLRGLLRGNMMRADLSPEQIKHINGALSDAVARIEAALRAAPDEPEE
ncbi:PadR family transcriptional regulator [Martelella alba]|uniref:PadR family transcriptional regulator n=2 Tax=Martelella alba TaxID=2590451 RepID=A0ABY2SP48_9HYPH|nr:PadR family transcriptional regulator [Martelella alba]